MIVCQSPEGRVVQVLWTALRLLERSPTFPARRALPQTSYVRAEYMTIDQRFPRMRQRKKRNDIAIGAGSHARQGGLIAPFVLPQNDTLAYE